MNEESIFAAAVEKTDPAERAAYLELACGGDPHLRRQVESLLQAHQGAGRFLEEPALEQGGTANEQDTDATLAEAVGGDDLLLSFLLPPSRPDALGRLKHYEVLEVVGRGGMGVVFKALDEVLQRVVAIKVMAPQLATSAAARKRFLREAQAAAAVRDEHVVDIHAVGEVNGLPYLVMELVTGVSLQERLDCGGPLELKEILRIGMQTANGLAAAHRQGLIHRDIKPANILLENGVQRVKITDFGLARAVDDASLTQSGVVAGTPQYMAPEQARGEAVDHRADLFSLGSVLYAMCTGHPPFRASTTLAVLRRVSEDSPRPLRDINPDVPDGLAALVARLHAKDPAGRFASAKEVAELLEQHLARLQQPAPPVPSPLPNPAPAARPRRARRWLAAATLLLAFGLGATETIGVTHVREYVATVLRIRTPDGTLVVEVNDPGVKVTIDGDGDEIAITGAGLQEVRLRPGRYRLRASKDGVPVPLDNELVTITRGGKQLVRVSREPAGAQASDKDSQPQATLWGPAMSSVTFSPDGKSLAVSSSNTVQVWDFPASSPRLVLRGHGAWVWTVAFSPDGKTLASACMDSTVKLWDLARGEERLTLKGHTDKVWSVAFSTDGKTLVSASDDGSVRLWDAATGKQQKLFGGHNPHAYSAELTPDGKTLVSGAYDGDVRLWDVAGQKVVATLPGHTAVVRLALSGDGKTLATASRDRTIRLWNLGSRQLRRTLTGHTLPIERVALSPDGKLLATVSGDYQKPTTPGEIKVWDVASGKEVLSLSGHQGPVHGVAFAPDGKTLATASADGTVKLWDLRRWSLVPSAPATGPLPFVILGHGGRAEQGFATLAAAAAAALSGDVIEVRRDGPFVSPPIRLGDKPLRVRAARGCRPVIRLATEGNPVGEPLLDVDAPLTLEGLELQRTAPRFSGGLLPTLICCGRPPVVLAGCRLLIEGDAVALFAQETSALNVHNCEIISLNWFYPLDWVCPPGGRLTVENTLITGGTGGVAFHYRQPDLHDVVIRLRHNTLAADKPLKLYLDRRPQERNTKPIRVEASDNVFHARTWVFGFDQSQLFLDENKALEPAAAVEVLRRLLDWREDRSLSPARVSLLGLSVREQPRDVPCGRTLNEWKDLWKGGSTGCLQGPILYWSGGVRLSGDPRVTAPDFHLHGNSAGYHGSKDGRDLGIDSSLVGPGARYERWQKTAGYRQWLEDVGLKDGNR